MREQHDPDLTTRLAQGGATPPDDGHPVQRRGAFGLSGTQITAGALAAVTSAALGSQLGVAGTVAGAAVASVVSTVGSAVYQRYLERTAETVRATAARAAPLGRRRRDAPGAERTGSDASPSPSAGPHLASAPTQHLTAPNPSPPPTSISGPAGPSPRAVGPTAPLGTPVEGLGSAPYPDTELLGPDVPARRGPDSTVLLPRSAGTDRQADTGGAGAAPVRRRRPTRVVVVGGLLSFLVAMAVVVGIELVRGESLSGGSAGTSISGLFGGEPLFHRDGTHPPADQRTPADGADVVVPADPTPPAGTGATDVPEAPTTSGEELEREPAGNAPSGTEPPTTTVEPPAEGEPERTQEPEDGEGPAPGARLEVPGPAPTT
ncbi:hypothetical protein [Actinoalloteichus spitiensis]|uniref:hypothetical protein n=1 Tax=Actinoalloteichus spitiensis TaxID=252394 RepID=UPI0003643E34|nr:hypothetical protein [Actinoalloteichus spitiensis]